MVRILLVLQVRPPYWRRRQMQAEREHISEGGVERRPGSPEYGLFSRSPAKDCPKS
jgi:hypothetical protein